MISRTINHEMRILVEEEVFFIYFLQKSLSPDWSNSKNTRPWPDWLSPQFVLKISWFLHFVPTILSGFVFLITRVVCVKTEHEI